LSIAGRLIEEGVPLARKKKTRKSRDVTTYWGGSRARGGILHIQSEGKWKTREKGRNCQLAGKRFIESATGNKSTKAEVEKRGNSFFAKRTERKGDRIDGN